MSSSLFTPLTIRSLTFRNRIAVSPMCEYSAEDGFANDWHLVHLGSRAVGGAGLVIMEATAVSPEGRITPGCLGLWQDEHIPFLQRITTFISAQGAIPGIQLAHAGRKASHTAPWLGNLPLTNKQGAWQTIGPSAIPFNAATPAPLEMDSTDIERVIQAFADAAKRALTAGFKVLEVHAAHGYLINSFLSPLSNHRTDDYGGSFHNRARLLLRIVAAVQQVWPEAYPLFVRISATEWAEGGWNMDDSVALAHLLKQQGVDLVDCSSGGNIAGARIPLEPMYQAPFAERIKKETGMRTGAVGLITTAQQAESIIREEKADLVLVARQLLRDPYFPLHAAYELGVDIPWPNQYLRAKLPVQTANK